MSEVHKKQMENVSGVSPQKYISFFKSIDYSCHLLNHDGTVGHEFNGDEDFVLVNIVLLPR